MTARISNWMVWVALAVAAVAWWNTEVRVGELGRVALGRVDGQSPATRTGWTACGQLEAPAMPKAVRDRGRQVLDRLSAWEPTDPDHARAHEYLQCPAGLPWTVRSVTQPDLPRAKAILDAGHAGHGPAKQRLLDYSPCAC